MRGDIMERGGCIPPPPPHGGGVTVIGGDEQASLGRLILQTPPGDVCDCNGEYGGVLGILEMFK